MLPQLSRDQAGGKRGHAGYKEVNAQGPAAHRRHAEDVHLNELAVMLLQVIEEFLAEPSLDKRDVGVQQSHWSSPPGLARSCCCKGTWERSAKGVRPIGGMCQACGMLNPRMRARMIALIRLQPVSSTTLATATGWS